MFYLFILGLRISVIKALFRIYDNQYVFVTVLKIMTDFRSKLSIVDRFNLTTDTNLKTHWRAPATCEPILQNNSFKPILVVIFIGFHLNLTVTINININLQNKILQISLL